MTTPNAIEKRGSSLIRDWLNVARFYLGSRRGILALAAVAIVAGFAFNWSWLVATGVAPILIAVLPCAVMCGLGLCFHKLFGASHSTERPRPSITEDQTGESPARPNRADSVFSASDCCDDATNAAAPAQSKSLTPTDDEREITHR